jgi:hypothetical protein
MRRFIQLLFAFWFGVSMTLAQVSISAAQTSTYGSDTDGGGAYSGTSSGSHFDTSGYTPDQSESQALTEYLTQRKLPLVGAQVLNGPEGRMVVLYGFVGSDFGKADAVKKTRRFLHNSAVRVDNRIHVRPELLASNRPSSTAGSNLGSEYPPAGGYASNPAGSSSPDASSYPGPAGPSSPDASAYPGPESYKAQQANPYTQQLTSMMPLIALLGALGMSMAGGSSGFSFGSSPFGSQPYRSPYPTPYGGYGSPYGGSPFGGSPFGGSPFGSSPYGGSPYGNPPYGSGPYSPP